MSLMPWWEISGEVLGGVACLGHWIASLCDVSCMVRKPDRVGFVVCNNSLQDVRKRRGGERGGGGERSESEREETGRGREA